MPRQLAITKRVDLSSVGEGWEGCYAIVTPATYAEYSEMTKMDLTAKDANHQSFQYLMELAKKHFLKGEVMGINDAGELEKMSMELGDFDTSIDIVNIVGEAVVGVAPDPKGSSTTTDESLTQNPPTSTSGTKTP